MKGKIISEENEIELILTNGEYFDSFTTTNDNTFVFENIPNGTYNLSVAGQSSCAQITVSVPEGHAELNFNYRLYKKQCMRPHGAP